MGIIETLVLMVTCFLKVKELKEEGKAQQSSYKIYVLLLIVLGIVGLIKLSYLVGLEVGDFLYKLIN